MVDLVPEFKAREHQMMLAWMHRDPGAVKSAMTGDCLIMIGATPPVLLDRSSFVENLSDRFALGGFCFHEVTARKHGKLVWFTGHVELELRVGYDEWKAGFLLTDLWRKTAFGGWKVEERSLAPLDPNAQLSNALRTLQLWR